jgi:pimeloyl-ACP methyl ester carboxylesterase
VTSRDGTEIAYWTSGQGPPLVLVHGGLGDHTRWGPLLPFLEPRVTAHAMDRRGRPESGDAPRYQLERESEDVAALVDAVAGEVGAPVDVYGHSHGGFAAFGAATLTGNIRRLVLYEGWPVPDPSGFELPGEVERRVQDLLAAGDRGAAVEAVITHYELMSPADLAALRKAPSWPGRLAAADAILRECRAEAEARLDVRRAARIRVPVLLLVGDQSSDPARAQVQAVAAALPDARVLVLEGQGHVADAFAPELFAGHLLAFLEGR